MEIVVTGRNVEVPDHYRQLVEDKLRKKVDKFDHKVIRIDVELHHEKNRRQHEQCQRVEITCRSRGPVIRAEACNKDFTAAFEAAAAKLGERLRRSADRRRVHHGRRTPVSVGQATAMIAGNGNGNKARPVISEDVDPYEGLVEDHLPGRIVREKEHRGEPMTVDDALFHMELVGHDFYLFHDKETGRPSVVYRRKGFDYGILRLQM
ncbi:ribosome hibernation-promoting factor, HPF/YfiA family [Stackebrandtia nassauensis]|uniref:Ribosome hibernation promoting factor n=1 Tax=Stackebrandtia nassauensis (strain DSM 44728 / CIP 108903 / NRRL B-16338 / NBRC 102104 / LLR-40K-21) TaxID=446470 RepID=D3PYI2_STANL|nr:ribosome-associated translation inhibitor RaiA [Stackebrandtia nassauensis]ADD41549.1 sigma 54 modulation protein/ribosomal protein S30EA [Stackebrandtia nassauensis DSM 44728]